MYGLHDEELVAQARARLRAPFILGIISLCIAVLPNLVFGSVAGVAALSAMLDHATQPLQMVIMLGVLVVAAVLIILPAAFQAGAMWMAGRMRSRGWIVIAGVTCMVAGFVQFIPMFAAMGVCGCATSPVVIALGMAAGILYIVAASSPEVLDGIDALDRLDGLVDGQLLD